MRMLIKRLLKKHRYPPEGMDDAVQTVMTQCELWTDNNDMGRDDNILDFQNIMKYSDHENEVMKVAEEQTEY